MTKKKKHTKKKRQQPKPKKQKVIAKQSINGFNLFETQMRAMGKRLLKVFKDKDTVNATLREHIETIEAISGNMILCSCLEALDYIY